MFLSKSQKERWQHEHLMLKYSLEIFLFVWKWYIEGLLQISEGEYLLEMPTYPACPHEKVEQDLLVVLVKPNRIERFCGSLPLPPLKRYR